MTEFHPWNIMEAHQRVGQRDYRLFQASMSPCLPMTMQPQNPPSQNLSTFDYNHHYHITWNSKTNGTS